MSVMNFHFSLHLSHSSRIYCFLQFWNLFK